MPKVFRNNNMITTCEQHDNNMITTCDMITTSWIIDKAEEENVKYSPGIATESESAQFSQSYNIHI